MFGLDELVPEVEIITADDDDSGHGVKNSDNESWKNKWMEWAHAMWDDRGTTRI